MKKKILYVLPVLFGLTLTGCAQEISKSDLNKTLVGKQTQANLHKEEFKGVEVKGNVSLEANLKGDAKEIGESRLRITNNYVFRTNSVNASESTSDNYFFAYTKTPEGKEEKDETKLKATFITKVNDNNIQVANIFEGVRKVTGEDDDKVSISSLATLVNKGETQVSYKESLENVKTTALDYLNSSVTEFLAMSNLPTEDLKIKASNIFGNEKYETTFNAKLNDFASIDITSNVTFKENYLHHFEVKLNGNSKHTDGTFDIKFGVSLDINKFDKEINIPKKEYTETVKVEIDPISAENTYRFLNDLLTNNK